MPSFLLLIFTASLLASFTQPEAWQPLEFNGVTPNQLTYQEGGMTVAVAASSSPLVSVFPAPKTIREITITGKISGTLSLNPDELWTENHDDALLRIGLIEPGTTKLSPFQRIAAPSWVKSLEKMFNGKIIGLGKIHCFLLMPDASMIGKTRTNPKAQMFEECIIAAPDEDGSFTMKLSLEDAPLHTAGLWLLADGDDTDSTFSVTITEIVISE